MAAIEGLGSVSSLRIAWLSVPAIGWSDAASCASWNSLMSAPAAKFGSPGQYDGAHFRVLRHPERLAELGGELVR